MFTRRDNRHAMHSINGHLTRVMAQPDQWQVARISRLERISRVDVNARRELEEIMANLDTGTYAGELEESEWREIAKRRKRVLEESEKREIAKWRKRKFMDIAVPHGIITVLCLIVCVLFMKCLWIRHIVGVIAKPRELEESEKREIAKRRKRKFMDIAVPHGIITVLCLIICVIFLVQTGKSIAHGEQLSEYFTRQEELDNLIKTILQEYGAVSMTLVKDTKSSDLSQTYDITDEKIEQFLPDKTLVKWTILNMLRDYRSSDPGFGPFHEKLVKQARFYNKVVVNVRYTVQAVELGFMERHGWKLAYDFQMKTRQLFKVRLLINTLQALHECLVELDTKSNNGRKCLEVSLDSIRSFTGLEVFITELCAGLTTLESDLNHLSMSYRILSILHKRILEITNATNDSFKLLYTAKVLGEMNEVTIQQHNMNESQMIDNLNISLNNDTGEQIGNESTPTINMKKNTNTSNVNTNSMHMKEQIIEEEITIADFITILRGMEEEIRMGMEKNWKMQKNRNKYVTKESVLGFSLAFVAAFGVMFLTAIFVTVLRGESELVVCVGDWLKHITDDLNEKRDTLHGFSKKIVPSQFLSSIDLHESASTMFPYKSNGDATFLMFSISHFTSYFELFTAEQTIHILTLVMQLIDERLHQYNAISVTSMGHCQIIFSDTSYNNRAHHASELANLALDIMSCCSDLEIGRQPPHSKLHVSIGLHSGPCIGMLYLRNGVVNFVTTGTSMNVLQKVHKTAVPNRVQITEPTYKLLEPLDTYSMYVRGNINVKEFSVYKVYWLNGRRISTGTSDCESLCSRIGSWIEMERKPLYRLDEIEGTYEPIDKPRGIFSYTP